MRTILLILIVAVVGLLIAVATGFLNITQTRSAEAPQISAQGKGVTARGGQSPAFDVETGSVSIGTKKTNVVVPTLQVVPPDEQPANNVNSSNTAG
ncbi:MAG TPA: hypothetical protein VFP53_04345 [Sphingomicrobium sp.]|nr:hypothetical protein [Sphingomicrobium sp.]